MEEEVDAGEVFARREFVEDIEVGGETVDGGEGQNFFGEVDCCAVDVFGFGGGD